MGMWRLQSSRKDISFSWFNIPHLIICYPAADFVRQVKTRPDTTAIQINIKATKLDSYFDNNIIGNASIEVPKLLQDIGLIQN